MDVYIYCAIMIGISYDTLSLSVQIVLVLKRIFAHGRASIILQCRSFLILEYDRLEHIGVLVY